MVTMNTLQRPLVLCAVLLLACSPRPSNAPFPDDAYTISSTRPITDVERGEFDFEAPRVTVSNDFPGGRFSAATTEGDSVLVLRIAPENAPINNSAWYAFKAWAPAPATLNVRLTYEEGRHRYFPKVRSAAESEWAPLDSAQIHVDEGTGDAVLRLPVGPDTIHVVGQELRTLAYFDDWTQSLALQEGVTRRAFGTTPRGHPLLMLEAGSPDAERHVLFISRQHPPEVSGTLALVPFLEELLGDSPLAQDFRSRFRIHAVPLMNPDGVELGHWRHNTGGVDLNRDWVAFHQPETRAVRDEMARILSPPGSELWFFADFHATNRDVLYTLDRSLETRPADVLDPWVEYIRTALPEYELSDAPSDGGHGVVSRDWAWREYQAPGMVYEVGDDTPRPLIREVARTAARGTMEILLERAIQAGGS